MDIMHVLLLRTNNQPKQYHYWQLTMNDLKDRERIVLDITS